MIELVLQKLPGPALCAQSDPETWFPTNETPQAVSAGYLGDEETQNTARAAKAICQRCTVRLECLQEALDNKIDHGIWGGLSVKERRKLRKAQK